jgi:hypothetical protein
MDVAGKLINITRDILSGKLNITFQIENASIDELNDLAKLDRLNIIATQFKEKRSLNANSYFHTLCDKLADKLMVSNHHCKNLLISSYGQKQYEDGEIVTLRTNIPIEKMQEKEYLHCEPYDFEYDDDGNEYVCYYVYRGSHTYDTKEMSRLIEGTVEECSKQGIATMTPKELERLLGRWQTKDSAS